MWVQKVPGGGAAELAYAPDGRTLYTLDGGGHVTAWDVPARTGRRLFHLDRGERWRARGLFLIDDGRYLIVPTDGGRVWDVAAGAPLPPLPPQLAYGYPRPARSGPLIEYVTADRTGVGSYDVVAGRAALVLPAPGLGDLRWFARAPDGGRWALLGTRGAVLVRPDGSWSGLTPPFEGTARFAPGGELVWMNFARLQVWDADTLAVRVPEVACNMLYQVLAFSPAAPVFAALNRQLHLTLFSLRSGEPIRSLDFALGRAVQCVAFAPDGLTCAVGGSNKQFAVFDVDV